MYSIHISFRSSLRNWQLECSNPKSTKFYFSYSRELFLNICPIRVFQRRKVIVNQLFKKKVHSDEFNYKLRSIKGADEGFISSNSSFKGSTNCVGAQFRKEVSLIVL